MAVLAEVLDRFETRPPDPKVVRGDIESIASSDLAEAWSSVAERKLLERLLGASAAK